MSYVVFYSLPVDWMEKQCELHFAVKVKVAPRMIYYHCPRYLYYYICLCLHCLTVDGC
jgi:hypothetical protein